MTSVALLGPAMLAASLLAASLQGPAPAGGTALATQQRAAARLLGQLDAPRRTAHVVAQLPDLEATLDVYGRPASLRDDEPDRAPGISEPVVKVYTVHCSPNLHMPWTNKPQEESSGSGFTIETDGRRCILTNAHVVADATYLEVRKAGDARKYVARRLKVCHDCDLATLVVDDDAFWAGVSPLELGPMPSLQDEVSVVGYPEGGEGVSITQGVVSRIEIQRYTHSGASLLAIQIDAAINPGNSGGPALDEDGAVIGVAFQNQHESQNIGYVIPVPTIEHFLADTRGDDPSKCDGFCSMGIFWQPLDNEQLRCYLGLGDRTGVLVRGVLKLAAAHSVLREGDVLLEADGHAIANDGTFAVGQQERLSFQHLIHLKFRGDALKLRLLRDGDEIDISLPVQPLPRLVPPTAYDESPPYFIFAGLVFVPLTEPYLHEWGDDWLADAPQDLVALTLQGLPTQWDEQVVILSRCFPSKQTAGYGPLHDRQVVSVNGEKVRNLAQMYARVRHVAASEPFVRFELATVGGPAVVVVESARAEAEGEEILQTYRIPAAASADLLAGHGS